MPASRPRALRRAGRRSARSAGRITRRFATPAARAGPRPRGGLDARGRGSTPRVDAVGNVLGRRGGGERTLLLGSHLDTVRDAGRYDGPLGVLAAVGGGRAGCASRAAAVRARGRRVRRRGGGPLRHGVSSAAPCWPARSTRPGSSARDAAGVAMAEAIARLRAATPSASPVPATATCSATSRCTSSRVPRWSSPPARRRRDRDRRAVRARATFTGAAAHAGTTPMGARRDAPPRRRSGCSPSRPAGGRWTAWSPRSASSRWSRARRTSFRAARRARSTSATPTTACASDAVSGCAPAPGRSRASAACGLDWEDVQATAAVPCDVRRHRASGGRRGGRHRRAGAATGRAAPATTRWCSPRVAPAAMLFVRCAGGVSHHPDEAVAEADVAVALDVLEAACSTVVTRGAGAPRDVAVADGVIAARRPRARRRRARGARRPRAARAARRGRRPRALQRARAAPTGRASRPARAALAAGGGTTRRRHAAQRPPADRRRGGLRRQARRGASASARVDFALWGGLVPGNAATTSTSSPARGVVGFKAFMCRQRDRRTSRAADDPTLVRGDGRAARARAAGRRARRERRDHGGPAARALADGGTAMRDCARVAAGDRRGRGDRARDRCWPRRPAARCTSCTSPPAAAWRSSPRRGPRGVDVTCETCPHYLVLDRGGRRAARRGRQVRAAAAARRRARGAVGGARRRPVADGHVRPLAVPAGDEGRGPAPRVGRDRRRADARSRCFWATGGWRPWPHSPSCSRASLLDGCDWPARAASSPAPTPTWCSSTCARARVLRAEDLHQRHPVSPFVGRTLRGARRAHDPARPHGLRRAAA